MEYDLSISRTLSIKHNKNLEFQWCRKVPDRRIWLTKFHSDWHRINISAAYFIVRTDKSFKNSKNDWHVPKDFNISGISSDTTWSCTVHSIAPPPPIQGHPTPPSQSAINPPPSDFFHPHDIMRQKTLNKLTYCHEIGDFSVYFNLGQGSCWIGKFASF